MRRLFTYFRIVYNFDPKLPSLTEQIIAAPTHPLHLKFREDLSRRRRNPFWYVITGNLLQEKRIIRSKACRKLRLAFKEALAGFNYDNNGNSLKLEAQPALRGSLEIHPVKKEVVEARHGDLKDDMVKVLEFIKTDMQRTRPPMRTVKVTKR